LELISLYFPATHSDNLPHDIPCYHPQTTNLSLKYPVNNKYTLISNIINIIYDLIGASQGGNHCQSFIENSKNYIVILSHNHNQKFI